MKKKVDWAAKWSLSDTLNVLEDLARLEPCYHDMPYDIKGRVGYSMQYPEGRHWDDLLSQRQLLAYFQKLEDVDIGIDKERVALDAWLAAERKCAETNRNWSSGRGFSPRVESVIYTAQQKITRVLNNGKAPALSELTFKFGPGATTSVGALSANMRNKLSARLSCSEGMFHACEPFLTEMPLFVQDDEVCLDVMHGKLTFVPKSAKTYRSIVVEPTLNGLVQKGIGSYLKSLLMRHGLNLRDQGRNQFLAYRGSLSNRLATVDLSSASDTLAYNVVQSLLPEDWFLLLSAARTATVNVGSDVVRLEKFSSMGNAYTFELESLIFWALSLSVCDVVGVSRESVSVFGDDIIVPVEAYDLLEETLTACGFSLNMEKSYANGPFRESCGADFYQGINIRPAYVKKRLSYSTLFVLHNFFVRNGDLKKARFVEKIIPEPLRLYGPNGFGDGHLLGDFQLRQNREIRRGGWQGGFFDTFSLKPLRAGPHGLKPGDYRLPAYSVYVRSGAESETDFRVVRGSRGYYRTSIYTLEASILR